MSRLLLVTLVLLSFGARASAEGQASLIWRAPASCPTAQTARSRIEQRLTLEQFVVDVTVTISEAVDHFVARIDAGEASHDTRTLRGVTCDELVDAVAIIVARLARQRARPLRAAEMSDPDTLGRDSGESLWRVGARLSAVSGIGVVPDLGLAGEVAIVIRRRAAFVELAHARWARPATVTSARIGWRASTAPFRGWLTAEAGATRRAGADAQTAVTNAAMESTGAVTLADHVASTQWLAAGAGVGVEWRLRSWVRLVGATEAAVSAHNDSAGSPSRVSVRASCGLEIGW